MAPKRARQEARKVERSEDDELLKCLIQKVSPEVLVDDWLAEYDQENSKESAICQLLKLFIDLSGYTGKIPEDLVCGDHQTIVKDIAANYCESCSDVPLYNKMTRLQVAAFLQRLVQKSGASVLCDQYMMDKVTRYLSQMALSKVRPLRYVGTYLMLKIVTATLNILMAIQRQEQYAKRQSIIDQSKSSSSRTIDHTEVLNNRVTEFEETVKELTEMIFNYLIPCCFTKRYRDVCPEIVSFCMGELGCWMEICPMNFQEKAYFDTYKIMLYHPSVNVRRTCLLALKQLFSKKSGSEVLIKLSQSLKGRLQHLTKDKSVDVAALALVVLTTMVQCYGQSVLDLEGRKKKGYSDGSVRTNTSILRLVYSKHLSIAYEAGKLLGQFLLQEPHSGDSQVNSSRTSVSSTGDSGELLMQIVRFFSNSKLPNHAVYLIDALKGFDPVLTDWDAMTDPLLKHELENDAEELDLIKVMRACVQVACSGTPPAGREKNFKKTTITRNRTKDNRTKMTDHFIPLMPRLLLQYRTDVDKVTELLKILRYLDLNQYKTPRQGLDLVAVVNAFESILDILDMKDSDEILKLCCCFLHKISEEEASTSTTECNNIWRKIETRNFMNMKSLNSRVAPDLKQGNIVDTDDFQELEKYLRRLVVFSKYRNLGFLNLWDEVFVYIEKAASAVVPYHVTLHAIDICEQTLLWDLLALCEREESQDDNSAGSSSSTGERATQLRAQLVELLNVLLPPLERCRGRVARKCYITICVLLNSFYYALPGNPALSSLWYEADEEVKTHLQSYTEEQFFRNGNGAPKDAKDRCECLRLYCELLVLYKLDIQAAVHILKYYHGVYKVYFGVIGWMLETILDRRRNDAAGLMLEALMISFQELSSTGVVEEAHLSQIKETADNFGKILSKFVRHREVIVFLHKQAILFACEEGSDNTLFLVPMMGLVSLLPAQDCMPMARLLDQLSKSFTETRRVQDPVARYRAKLLEGHAKRSTRGSKGASGASETTQAKSGKKRGQVESSTPAVNTPKRPRKPKLDVRVMSTRNKEGKKKRVRASSAEGIGISDVSEIRSSPQPGTSKVN